MADVCDDADLHIEASKVIAMAAVRSSLQTREFEPKGICYNCEAKVGPSQLYCDDQCAGEHDEYMRLTRRRGNGLAH